MLTAMRPENDRLPDPTLHRAVLANETLEWLAPHPSGRYIDATLGGAGHTELILARSAPDGRVLGIDADPDALERAQARLQEAVATGRLLLRHANFDEMGT